MCCQIWSINIPETNTFSGNSHRYTFFYIEKKIQVNYFYWYSHQLVHYFSYTVFKMAIVSWRKVTSINKHTSVYIVLIKSSFDFASTMLSCFIVCQQLSDSGRDCAETQYEIRWYYKTDIQRCDRFWYRGCGGNNNNFKTEEECQQTCTAGGGRPGTWLFRGPGHQKTLALYDGL